MRPAPRSTLFGAWMVAALFFLGGCAQGKCDVLCGSATVFRFEPPLEGDVIRFEVDRHVLECDPDCPSDPFLRARLTSSYGIERLTWSDPSRTFRIRVKVDGATRIDRELTHRPADEHSLCGMICRNAEFTFAELE